VGVGTTQTIRAGDSPGGRDKLGLARFGSVAWLFMKAGHEACRSQTNVQRREGEGGDADHPGKKYPGTVIG